MAETSEWVRERFGRARVARLATVTPDGAPHLVPVTFVLDGDVVWTAVDEKPKSTRSLRRLDNIAADPRVSLLVDHYGDDWSTLWWVRVDGTATIVDDLESPSARAALTALVTKYPSYESDPPQGPLIQVAVKAWRSWAASHVAQRDLE